MIVIAYSLVAIVKNLAEKGSVGGRGYQGQDCSASFAAMCCQVRAKPIVSPGAVVLRRMIDAIKLPEGVRVNLCEGT